jgi:tRNA nucleotidyltransferase (CCA-adding enzyme)
MQITMPEGARAIIKHLNDAGYEAYIVGGCVRDALLHKAPGDWDICTSARPADMVKVFSNKRIIPTGIEHGTLTILEEDGAYEVTAFRIDGEYTDHRRPDRVEFTSDLRLDLSRRDFTINAMAYHPDKGLIDLFGGMDDLRSRIVRTVGNPRHRFDEDGLRVLRMVRFATVLDFEYEPATYAAAKERAPLLKYISRERIRTELDKILVAPHVARGLWDMVDLQMFSYFMPLLCHEMGYEQKGKYHFLDVFEHSILSCGLIRADKTLRLAMLLHDVGKPFTRVTQEDGSDAFPDHARVGADLADGILRKMTYDNHTRERVVTLIAHHCDGLTTDPTVLRHALSQMGQEALLQLIEVKVADMQAHDLRGRRYEMLQFFSDVRKQVLDICARGDATTIKDLAIDGRDVMALGFRGKAVGGALHAALEDVLAHPDHNDRDYLLALVQAHRPKEL